MKGKKKERKQRNLLSFHLLQQENHASNVFFSLISLDVKSRRRECNACNTTFFSTCVSLIATLSLQFIVWFVTRGSSHESPIHFYSQSSFQSRKSVNFQEHQETGHLSWDDSLLLFSLEKQQVNCRRYYCWTDM